MSEERAIVLDQALLAVLGAVHELGYDAERVKQKAQTLLIDNTKYREVDHPYNTKACDEINRVLASVEAKAPI